MLIQKWYNLGKISQKSKYFFNCAHKDTNLSEISADYYIRKLDGEKSISFEIEMYLYEKRKNSFATLQSL